MDNFINILENDIVDDIDSILEDTPYKLFDENLNNLNECLKLNNDIFNEAVKAPYSKTNKNIKKVVSNTIDTTKDVFSAYDNVTDGGSNLIKSSWDLVIRIVEISTKLIEFILSKLAYIPDTILKMINKASEIPSDIINKLKGNIKLYITIDDIDLIYNKLIMYNIDTFISTTAAMSEGEIWGSMFNKSTKVAGEVINASNNDMKLSKKANSIYQVLKNIEFTPTVISLDDDRNKKVYISNEAQISFKDLRGKEFKGNYLEALSRIVEDLNNRKDEIIKIQDKLKSKYDLSQMNQTFAKLSSDKQQKVVKSIRTTGKVISLISNMINNILKDMQTINKVIKKIDKVDKK